MADNKITLELGLDAAHATRSLKTFQSDSQKAVRALTGGYNTLKVAAAGAVAFLGSSAVLGAIKSVTDAASIQEDAVNDLNSALQLTGKYSAKTSQELQVFASSIQANSKFGDEAILTNAALIQSLGNLSKDGLKTAIQNTVDLAAALKIDLKGAALLVGKAAAGEVSSFSRFGLVIKKGADNAETFAKAMDAISSKFGGAAANQVNTYSGAMQQLQNTYGDFNEELGFSITKNPQVIKAIKSLSKSFEGMIDYVRQNSEGLQDFASVVANQVAIEIPETVRSVNALVEAMRILAEASPIGKFTGLLSRMGDAVDDNTSIVNTATKAWMLYIQTVLQVYKAMAFVPDKISHIWGGDLTKTIGLDDAIQKIGALREELAQPLPIPGPDKSPGEVVDDMIKNARDSAAKYEPKDIWGDLWEIPIAGALPASPAGSKGGTSDAAKSENVELAKLIGETIAGVMTSGKHGGQQAGAEALGYGADLIGQYFGAEEGLTSGLLTPIFKAAQQDPEELKKSIALFVEGFVGAVPAIVEGLAAAAPAVIDALVNSLILEGGITRIVDSLLKIIPKVGYAIGKSIWEWLVEGGKYLWNQLNYKPEWLVDLQHVFSMFSNTFTNIFSDMYSNLSNALGNGAIAMYNSMITAGNSIAEQMRKAVTPGGDAGFTIGGTTGQITEGIKARLASGGVVPSGYPNDDYNAGLTTGELVVPPKTTENLFAAIDNIARNGGNNDISGALLLRIISLLEQPMAVQTQVAIDGDAFADIQLKLSRQGARTAV